MNNSRRRFLRQLPGAIGALGLPFSLAGVPINLMAENTFTRMAKNSVGNDKVLIILQMHGGNDGLNSVIPVTDYELYYSKRANIAIPAKNSLRKSIPLDSTLAPEKQVALHPDMHHMKRLYDRGLMSVIQGVSYKHNNGSHFRGRDIWFMGGSAEEYLQSGWAGRYLQQEIAPKNYPEDFPNSEMPDPLAIEMGSEMSLVFHQEGNIPTSISIDNPQSFADLVGGLEGFNDEEVDPRGIPPQFLQQSAYYNELDWILNLEDKSKDYAARLAQVYQAGNAIPGNESYPETYPFNAPQGSLRNPLSAQLKIVSRLLSGGCQTKIFLVKIGGFDTHAKQVESYDPTMGSHAALMYHISSAMSAFQDDLKKRGLDERVLTITTSEFGRRIHSNGSYGTDHGTGAPMFIFGRGVQPGVLGNVPDLNQANVEMQYDYRQIYGNIVKEWFEVDDTRLNDIFPGLTSANGTADGVFFQPLHLVNRVIAGTDNFISERFLLNECFPNPAREKTTISFRVNSNNHVLIQLYSAAGKKIATWADAVYDPGEHSLEIILKDVPAGNYIYQLQSGFFTDSKKLVVVK